MKKILIIFFVIIVLYSVFVIVDCIRLRKSASDTFLLITFEENYAEYETKYTGLGYSVVYYEDAFIDEKLHDGKYDVNFLIFFHSNIFFAINLMKF